MGKRLTTEEFIEKANKIHNNFYDYSLTKYKSYNYKIKIICPIHGEFEQIARNHIRGSGCRQCSYENKRIKQIDKFFIERAQKIHGNKYDYSLVSYVNKNTKVKILCPIHGEFWQMPFNHLSGHGCPACSGNFAYGKKEKIFNPKKLTTEEFIEKANKKHNNFYDYSLTEYNGIYSKVKIICPIHGEFEQIARNHLESGGCPFCGLEKRSKIRTYTTEKFIELAEVTHNNFYDYSLVNYIRSQEKITIICPIHGEFEQMPYLHLQGADCPKCNSVSSKIENEVNDYIISLNVNTEQNNKKILNGLELDIYLPNHNLAIEFNGLYWHSEQKIIDKKYHLKKTELCEEKDIRLIHIFEDEWLLKNEIVKNRLKHILGLNKEKIYARKTFITNIDSKIKNDFLNKYHIQGEDRAFTSLGAFYNDELIAVMTFAKPRLALGQKKSKNGIYELSRYVCKANINFIGGASKLFSYFIKNYNPMEIYSYSDRRWNTGNLYQQLGFSFDYNTEPNYWYIIEEKRVHRFKYRKSELNNLLENFNPDLSEYENMLRNGYDRIWDCGNSKWIWK